MSNKTDPRVWARLVPLIMLVAAFFALPGSGWAARLTLETDHFLIHFDNEMEEMAREVAVIVEEVHAKLVPRIGHVPAVKTHLIISDETDLANGFADPIIYPKITIYPVSPVFFSSYASGFSPRMTEWLRLVILHEYAHVLHLDMNNSVGELIRSIYGRVPLLTNPILLQSMAFIEGFATYHETLADLGGRGQDPMYRMFLRTMVLDDDFLFLDQILGHYPLERWKPGAAVYLYGYSLWQFMADRYGEDALGRFNRAFIQHLSLEQAFNEALGVSSGFFYDSWKVYLRAQFTPEIRDLRAQGVTPTEPLGGHGYVPESPTASPDGRKLAYISVNGPGAPALRLIEWEDGARKDRQLVSGVVMGSIAWSPDGDRLYYAKVEWDQNGTYSDLYRYTLATEREERLTKGLRAMGPAISPDGKRLVFTSRDALATRILELDLGATSLPVSADSQSIKEILAESDGAQRMATDWFPDGKSLVVLSHETGGGMDLLRLDLNTGKLEPLVIGSRARGGTGVVNQNAQFSPDGRFILFDSDRTNIYALYAYDIATGQTFTVARAITGLFDPTVIHTETGLKLVAMEYTADGYRLSALPYDSEKWEPYLEDSASSQSSESVDIATEVATDSMDISVESSHIEERLVRPYSAWNAMKPRFFLPIIGMDEAGPIIGAATIGYDAYQEHLYALEGGYGLDSKRPYFYFQYSGPISRRQPALWDLQVWQDTVLAGDNEASGVQRRGLSMAAQLNWPKVQSATSLWSQVQLSTGRQVWKGAPPGPWRPAQLAYVGLAHVKETPVDDRSTRINSNLTISAARFGEGWSQQGIFAAWRESGRFSWNLGRQSLDGTLIIGTSTFEDGYTLGSSSGRPGAWGNWSMKAHGPDLTGKHAARYVIGLNRQLTRFSRGMGTQPLFFHDLKGRIFTEGGAVWTSFDHAPESRWSIGVEASLTAYTAYSTPIALEIGAAMALEQKDRPVTIYWNLVLDEILNAFFGSRIPGQNPNFKRQ